MSSTEKQITFEQMPDALAELTHKVDRLTELITNKMASTQEQKPKDEWMNISELIEYLPDRPSRATVYGWVCARSIPFHKKTKKLSFLKSEIDAWLADTGHATADEMKDIALETFGYRKGGLR